MSNILGYGAYLPRHRITFKAIAEAWSEVEYARRRQRFGVKEKAVPARDENVITMSAQAAENALEHAGIDRKKLRAVIVGSMSPLFTDKAIATSVAQMLGVNEVLTLDCVQSSNSGVAALILANSMATSLAGPVLAIGADSLPVKPGGILESLCGAGAVALVVGPNAGIAALEISYSTSADVYDLWCPIGQPYHQFDDALFGELCLTTVANALKNYFSQSKTGADDYAYFVFSQPDGRMPFTIGRESGVAAEKIAGVLSPEVGSLGSASALLGLADVLDAAKPGEKILVASYGSGCADILTLKVAQANKRNQRDYTVRELVADKQYIDYVTYLKQIAEI